MKCTKCGQELIKYDNGLIQCPECGAKYRPKAKLELEQNSADANKAVQSRPVREDSDIGYSTSTLPKCPKCGTEASGRFCPECGYQMVKDAPVRQGYGSQSVARQDVINTGGASPGRYFGGNNYLLTGGEIQTKSAKITGGKLIFNLIFIVCFGAFPALAFPELVRNPDSFNGDSTVLALILGAFGLVSICFLFDTIWRLIATPVIRTSGETVTGTVLDYTPSNMSVNGRSIMNYVIRLDGEEEVIIYDSGKMNGLKPAGSKIMLKRLRNTYVDI